MYEIISKVVLRTHFCAHCMPGPQQRSHESSIWARAPPGTAPKALSGSCPPRRAACATEQQLSAAPHEVYLPLIAE